ncbi:hypothetical protein [Streptomyces sp. WM6378]|uniref:hypothetical protein n=1 Tax=Streptomyces sp. WM6378 TaxID=1415557 RepID=UPI0006ADCEF8|nr:hypothetical protein [Streptomyces sp. WM6378]KOU48227.1 hypothetical protein ADK54_11860 [Streptomyces sp. WM6378]
MSFRLPIDPRPLSVSERAVLEHILSADFSGASELRGQLDRTEVVALWGPGSASVDLLVREPVQHAVMASELVPVDAHVHDQSGEYLGELLVWADKGATLAALEFAWVTNEMPSSLPPVDQVLVTVR